MKKVILRSLALATVVAGFVSHPSFAQEATKEADADAAKFTPILNIQARYVLLDSTRKTNFDFLSQKLRLGGKFSQGAFNAVGEGELRGNNYGQYPTANADASGGQGIGVRQAFISYDVHSDANGSVSVTLGRFIPNSANVYGNDAITGWFAVSGFMSEDGVMAQYSGKLAAADLTAQVAVANALPLWLYNGGQIGTTNSWEFAMWGSGSAFKGGSTFNGNGGGNFGNSSNSTSNTSSKAYIADVSATVDAGTGKLELAAAYATKRNNVNSVVTTVTTDTPPVTTPPTANDVDYVEASIGFNHQDNLKAGVWYTRAMIGETKVLTDTNGGATEFGEGNGLKETYSIAGLGVQGNSKLFGMNNVLGKDGMLTFGAGAQMFMHRQSGTGALSDSEAAKNDVTMLSLGGGYTKGAVYSELNISHFMASNDVFLNQGNNNYTNSATQVYVVAGVSL